MRMNKVLEEILEKIAERAFILFKALKWKWTIERKEVPYSIRMIPSVQVIKNTLKDLLKHLYKKEEGFLATGRLLVVKSEMGYEFYIEIGWLPESCFHLSEEELKEILLELEAQHL